MSRSCLIATVGNSLLSQRRDEKEPPEITAISERIAQRNPARTAAALRKIAPSDRACGAEINVIHELKQRKHIQVDAQVHFCVSDTPDGGFMGQVLKHYWEADGNRVEVHPIAGLQDQKQDDFRRFGLRHLVQEIGKIVRNVGGPEYVAIDATGGYKAQIAFATLIGQALEIPVYYKHERFPLVICLPPMPIQLDYTLLGREAEILLALEQEKAIAIDGMELDPRLLPMLEEEEIDGARYASLSPIGEIYLLGYRQRFPPEKTLPPKAESQKPVRFAGDHHQQRGFAEYLEQVWRETPYISGGITGDYGGQRGIRDRRFYVDGSGQIVGEYRDRSNFGGRVILETTAKSEIQKIAVVEDLNQRYGK